MIHSATSSNLNLPAGLIEGAPVTRRFLSDLRGIFADPAAYERAVNQGNPMVYSVSPMERGHTEGDLHYALGVLMPGRIGREYFMTRGHYHAWRSAAEVYFGLSGSGMMLLEDEQGASRLLPLSPNTIVYVPGHTAHRTINTGTEPLVYLGIYPAAAGHDYDALAEKNFKKIVIEQSEQPVMIDREAFEP